MCVCGGICMKTQGNKHWGYLLGCFSLPVYVLSFFHPEMINSGVHFGMRNFDISCVVLNKCRSQEN